MNPIIKNQLNNVKVADLPFWDDNSTHISIPRKERQELTFELMHYYLIELADYLINPPAGFSLHENWNNGSIPSSKYIKCQCVNIMGKMIKILGVCFDYENKKDLDINWDGWLPLKGVTILREI